MKIHGIFLTGIISIQILGILSCGNKQNRKNFTPEIEINNPTDNIVNKIEVRKVDFTIITVAAVDCIDF